ncbi:MAG: pentapeptide repeat-containing protein [Ktedonobacterales bacterium]
MEVLDRRLDSKRLPEKDDAEGWRDYWRAHGQPWRTQPEISADRQLFLMERLKIQPDWRQGIYPFKDIVLLRADVEWLLAHMLAQESHDERHEARHDESDEEGHEESHEERPGIDLRGADLRRSDLSGLPLMRMRGGLALEEWPIAADEQRDMATVRLDRANLRDAHLENAILVGAHLGRAELDGAHLEGAVLAATHLERASLQSAHLEGAMLVHAHLEYADLTEASLLGTDLHDAQAQSANLTRADLRGTYLWNIQLQGGRLRGTRLQGLRVPEADWQRIRQWRRDFPIDLPPADMRGATMDQETDLFGIILGTRKNGFALLADVRWGDAIVTVVPWSGVEMLGDEQIAREPRMPDGEEKSRTTRIIEHETAIRANRQLAIVLQAQGLNEQAIRFIYRAQVLGRQLLWWRLVWGMASAQQEGEPQPISLGQRIRSLSAFLLSLTLDLISGYGSKVERCLYTYVIIVIIFTFAHYLVGLDTHSPLTVWGALAISIQSLHGRNFSFVNPTGPQVTLNTVEAVVGLLLESLVVSVITRRILGLG